MYTQSKRDNSNTKYRTRKCINKLIAETFVFVLDMRWDRISAIRFVPAGINVTFYLNTKYYKLC